MQYKAKNVQSSIRVLQAIVIGMCLVLVGRLYQLQILDFNTYQPLSQQNSVRQEYINPARGLIFDRHNNLLVDNQPIFTITVTPSDYKAANTPLLAKLLGVDQQDLNDRINEAQTYSWHRKSRLYTDVSFPVFSKIEENIWRLPGIGHQIESKRHYPSGVKAAHILGYLREVSDVVLKKSDRYQLGDKVGKSGLEGVYEDYLRGDLGTSYKLVNAYGQELGPYEEGNLDNAPTKGADLYTTIDTDLQAAAEKLMSNKTGAVVAMDPTTGAILAMVSAPEYDLSKLAGNVDKDYWYKLNTDSTRPLYNRAISSRQPPGSTFKPLMALVGLKLGLITPSTDVFCNGGYYKGRLYKCDEVHGHVNLQKAIAQSCNTYFFSLMNQIGIHNDLDKWHDLIMQFGLGSLNHIDLPGEVSGIIPDSAYFNKVFGKKKWGIGDVINLGIGQGVVSVSPLQMAEVTSEIANGGYHVQPHIVRAIHRTDDKWMITNPEKTKIGWVSENNIDIVKKAMRKVVTDGTARWYANVKGIEIAGKTGTAQNPHGNDHAWFISFAPYDHPRIAMAVLVENAGFGATSAVPISTLLIEKYITGKIEQQRLFKRMVEFKPDKYDTAGH